MMDREIPRTIAAASPPPAGSLAVDHPLLARRPGEILIRPPVIVESIGGVDISLPASVFLTVNRLERGARIDGRIVADLSDLQRKIGPLIDQLPFPRDNCAKFALDNLVVKISGRELRVTQEVATLVISGEVEVWTCLEIPFSSPLKTHTLPPQSFTALVPFRLAVEQNGLGLGLLLGQPSIDLRGDLGQVIDGILSIAGVDINAEALGWLQRCVSRDWLTFTLPEGLRKLKPLISDASLAEYRGMLMAELEVAAILDPDALLAGRLEAR